MRVLYFKGLYVAVIKKSNPLLTLQCFFEQLYIFRVLYSIQKIKDSFRHSNLEPDHLITEICLMGLFQDMFYGICISIKKLSFL